MTVPVIQSTVSEISVFSPEHTSHTLAWDVTPTPGNTLVAFITRDDSTIGGTGVITGPSGWDQQEAVIQPTGRRTLYAYTKTATASEPAVIFTFEGTRRTILAIVEVAGSFVDSAQGTGTSGTSHPLATASPTGGTDSLMLQVIVHGNAQSVTTYPSGWTLIEAIIADDGSSEWLNLFSKNVNPASGTYGGTLVLGASAVTTKAAMWFISTLPVADFTVDDQSLLEGETATFTDLSSGAPTSWAWTFGDGGTSTSQNPSHVYATAGSYSVTLTATNASGSDSETKSAYISVGRDVGYIPPAPAGALLEIYAADLGAARWGIAHWGEDLWSQAGWQNVTPQGITVEILWGSDRPELGILSVPSAASWAIDFYDPDRLLDPSNVDSPYHGDLAPGLPVRLSHRGTIVQTGQAESIGHSFMDVSLDPFNGYMRVTNAIAQMANADVPSDSTLSDTLYARAVDALSAAGLSRIQVYPPAGADPAVSPWLTGEREWTVWEWVKDAAQEALYIPYIDRFNALRFRPWSVPLNRGRSVDSPELLDLQVVTDYAGQYSVVQAREDVDTIIERALTPPPRYGARIFRRDEITIDPGDWADTVLADRGLPMLRWEPGSVYPLTALSVEQFATIESVEIITLSVPEASPPVNLTAIVLGGEITVRGKLASEALWRFKYNLAETADQPLTLDGGGPSDFLSTEAGDEFLYPDT